jgi:hypothetical protein
VQRDSRPTEQTLHRLADVIAECVPLFGKELEVVGK